MTNLLLYFALAALATIALVAGLAWLTRPVRKVDKLETTKSSITLEDESGNIVYYFPVNTEYTVQFTTKLSAMPTEPTFELSAEWDMELREWLFEHRGELVEESHNETPAEKATIDRWEREMHENAGKE